MFTFRKILCCIMLPVFLLAFAGCAPNEQTIEWTLHGTWVNASGEPKNTVTFSLSSKLPAEADPSEQVQVVQLNIDTTLFPYSVQADTPFSCKAYAATDSSRPPCFLLNCGSWHESSKSNVPMNMLLCPEEEWVIIWWSNSDDTFLVASTDPNADPAEIFSFYQEYVHVNQ